MKTKLTDIIPDEELPIVPVSNINFFLKNGNTISVSCALSEKDFIKMWNRTVFMIKILCDKGKYTFIRKRRVDSFVVEAV